MPKLIYNGIKITALSACVPKNVERNVDLTDVMSASDIANTIKMTGVQERRIAPKDVCTSDLCFSAAENIFAQTRIAKDSIDMLLLVTQTPDYRLPATACILQNRLGLPQNCGAFDINLGCSGFVYGLAVAFAFLQTKGINRVLLLAGETPSKSCNRRDISQYTLFGDCGTACIIEKNTEGVASYFTLNTDGSGENAIKIYGGGYRHMVTAASFEEKQDEYGNFRNELQGMMDGIDVFNFSVRCVPKSVKETVEFAGRTLSDIDYFVFHQANKFMMDHFCKKMKLPQEKVLFSLEKFGNTSSASIPLTIVLHKDEMTKRNNMLLCGYGVGLSYATCVVNMSGTEILPLAEVG